jgi:hypothetical protein
MKRQPTDIFRLGTYGLLCAVALFVALFRPASGLSVRYTHSPIVGGDELTMTAAIRVTDEQAHDGVKLTWRLPPWAEIVSADPPITHSSVLFGRLNAGDRRTATLRVRLRDVPGTEIALGYSLREMVGTEERYISGEERTQIASSAMQIEWGATSTVLAGSSVPFVLTNNGTTSLPAVILRLTDPSSAAGVSFYGRDSYRIGNMNPGERVVIPLDVDPRTRGRMAIAWEVQDMAQPVDRGVLRFTVLPSSSVASLDTDDRDASSTPRVATTVQYRTATGDQLGSGPNPPRLGETTTYWVTWTVTSTEREIQDIEIRGTLSSDVHATGRNASLLPGRFSTTDSTVVWHVPSLPVTKGRPATWSFEVEVTPTSTERGDGAPLVASTDIFVASH